jgi:hypothetical protein
MECDNTNTHCVSARHKPSEFSKTTRQSSTKFGTAVYISIFLCIPTPGNTMTLLKHMLDKDSMQSGLGTDISEWHITPICGPNMEGLCSYETYQTTRCRNPGDRNLNIHRRENFKSHIQFALKAFLGKTLQLWLADTGTRVMGFVPSLQVHTIQRYNAITLHRHSYLTCVSVWTETSPSEADSYITYELTVAQIVKKFPVLQGNPMVQRRVHNSPPPVPKPSHPISLKTILILSSHLQPFLIVPPKYLPYRRMFKIEVLDLNIILYYVAGMSGDLLSSCDVQVQWRLFGRPALSMCRWSLEIFKSILLWRVGWYTPLNLRVLARMIGFISSWVTHSLLITLSIFKYYT